MPKEFRFENKVVYLISPQNWGLMKVSKHHYALELAERGNRVFFIEPPSLEARNIVIRPSEEHPNLQIISYKPVFRGKRFLPAFLFALLLRLQIFLLIQKIGHKPDVVWSFSGFLFENLSWFGAEKSILFVADLFAETNLPKEVFTADLVLGVSDTICSKLEQSGREVIFINHGLNRIFEESALSRLKGALKSQSYHSKTRIGYVGNLRMEAIDRPTMKKIILNFKNQLFVFWGSFEAKEANLGGLNDLETNEFIHFLQNQKNVSLRGVVSTKRLAEEIQEVDLFWICWNINENKTWDGSNSHKILEYLSTGRPIISHYMSTYEDSNLTYMLPAKDNVGYLELFDNILKQLTVGESIDIIQARIQFALANSYSEQLAVIESLLKR